MYRRLPSHRRSRRWTALVAVVLLAPGCSGSGSDGATEAPTTSVGSSRFEPGLGEGLAPERGGRRALTGFDEVAATITAADGTTCEVCLLSATTGAQRQRGLMEVTDADLGGYDGMLFQFPDETDGGFWMRNTPLPLSIAYFDRGGAFVSATDMEPCRDSASCPTYPAEGRYLLALEVPVGALADIGVAEGSTIRVEGSRCPVAEPAP